MVLNTFIYFESLILIYLDPLGTSIVVFVLDNRKSFGKKGTIVYLPRPTEISFHILFYYGGSILCINFFLVPVVW